MIDFKHERLLSLAEAAASLPRNPDGSEVHRSTVFRWSSNGLRGVRLETLNVGGRRMTSEEALARFFAALTIATSLQGSRSETWTAASKSSDAAADLDAAGWK